MRHWRRKMEQQERQIREYNLPNDGLPNGWDMVKLGELSEVLDSRRVPVNSKEREKRIIGKREGELFAYYGATGQVGLIMTIC